MTTPTYAQQKMMEMQLAREKKIQTSDLMNCDKVCTDLKKILDGDIATGQFYGEGIKLTIDFTNILVPNRFPRCNYDDDLEISHLKGALTEMGYTHITGKVFNDRLRLKIRVKVPGWWDKFYTLVGGIVTQ